MQEACLLRFQETGDPGALQFLVDSLERCIKRQAGRALRWSRKRVPSEDLMSVGRLAVIKAANTHDVSRGVPFRLYASTFIHGDIYEFAMRNSMDVSFANSRKERRVQRMLFGLVADGEAQGMTRHQAVGAASRYLNITEEHAADAMQIRYSLPVDHSGSDEGGDTETFARPADKSNDVEEDMSAPATVGILSEVISQLNDEERTIILARHYGEKVSLDSLAERLGCSRDRVKRIETHAMKWLRLELSARGLEFGDLAA